MSCLLSPHQTSSEVKSSLTSPLDRPLSSRLLEFFLEDPEISPTLKRCVIPPASSGSALGSALKTTLNWTFFEVEEDWLRSEQWRKLTLAALHLQFQPLR